MSGNETPLLVAFVIGVCLGSFVTLCLVAAVREWWHRDAPRTR